MTHPTESPFLLQPVITKTNARCSDATFFQKYTLTTVSFSFPVAFETPDAGVFH